MRSLCLLSLLLCESPLHAAPRAAILGVEGEPALAAPLDRELGRAVAERGVREVLGPPELQARLTASPGVAAALTAGRQLISEATKATLYMRRAEAVAAAKDAVSKLEAAHARHHARDLLARAHGARAVALLLKPADEEGARAAFREALAADPSWRPADLAPRASQLLEEAQKARRASAPSVDELQAVSRAVGIDRLIWVHASAGASLVELELVFFSASERATASRRLQVPPGQVTARAAELIASVLAPGPTSLASLPSSGPVVGRSPEPPRPQPPTTTARPWYKRWWVWAIAGTVVVGTGLGLGLGLGLKSDTPSNPSGGFTFDFRY